MAAPKGPVPALFYEATWQRVNRSGHLVHGEYVSLVSCDACARMPVTDG
jgi:hypothetical protein